MNNKRNQDQEARYKGQGMGDYICSLCEEVTSDTRNEICEHCGATVDAFENPHMDYEDDAFGTW